MRVLHIIPDSVDNPQHLFLGSTKDIRGRTEYFRARDIPFDEISSEKRSDSLLLKKLRRMNLNHYTTALFEYPIYPASLRFLRQQFPKMKLLVRSHNADFYHFLHYTSARILHKVGPRRALRDFSTSFVRLQLNYSCARFSDYILSITKWEKNNYWRYLTNSSNVVTVPYFLPESYSQAISPITEKKLQCIFLMSTTKGNLPLLVDALKTFTKLAERSSQHCSEWDFLITGDLPSNIFTLPKCIRPTGFLDTPFKLLGESRAVALLSNLGFGFKTKILDAIMCKCYVLVAKHLYQRLPEEVRPYCLIVDTNSVESFRNALERCLEPFPDGNPNDVLRSQAFAVLDKILYDDSNNESLNKMSG